MKYILLYENYLTKEDQPDEYLYNNGFSDRYYICSNCSSNKLTPIPQGGFSSPKWKCDNCGEMNYAPKWVSPQEYNAKKFNL